MNEQWIQQMQQKMAGYEYPAPQLSWDEMDQALAVGKVRKTRVLWLKRMAAAAVFLLIAGVGYWSSLDNETEQMPPMTASVEDKPISARDEQLERQVDTVPMTGDVRLKNTKSRHKLTATSEPEISSISTVDADTLVTPVITEQEQPQAIEKKAKSADPPRPVIYPSDLRERKHIDNRLTAKVYMSSTMAGRQMDYNSQQGLPVSIKDSIKEGQTEFLAHHRLPVRFGLSLRYRLNNRWSIESGLSFTRLSSDITTKVDGVTTTTEQCLNYLGLPVNISCDLWQSQRFGLYISSGIMIEKSFDISPWQFSLIGAAGVEYKLTDIFSLYAEPGVGYYFKDGSTTPTIYQDRPLNFNLGFGLRFNLK